MLKILLVNYNKDLTDYTSSDDFDVIVYRFKDGKWDIFNSLNKASSNHFNTFDVGQGYWIKINNERTNWTQGVVQTALISRDSLKIDIDYSNLKNGWNIMSFSDTYIRYSPTGVFIPQAIISNLSSTITIHRLNRSENDRHSIKIPEVLFGDVYKSNNVSASARLINTYANNQEVVFGDKDRIRAIPAIKVEDNGSIMEGIIVLSDSKFEINSSGSALYPITTLSGQALNTVSNSKNFETVYGEYTNFLNVNELNDTDINVSMSLQAQKYSSSPLLVGGLGDTNKTQNALNILTSINKLTTKVGETSSSTSNAIYLTDLDFNTNLDYNVSNNYDSLLIASGTRFSVADSTYTKIYKFNRNGKFKLISSDGSIEIDSGDTTNMDTLITKINNAKGSTKVTATSLGVNSDGDSQFMLTSTKKGIRIFENDSVNLFSDIPLTSSSIASSDLVKGSIKSIHTFKDLLDVDIVFNRESIDGAGDFGNVGISTDVTRIMSTDMFSATIDANSPYTYTGNVFASAAMGAGPMDFSEGSIGIVNGDLGGEFSIRLRGTLVVGGDLNMGGGGRLIVYKTGVVIVKGNVNLAAAFQFPDTGGGRVYVSGTVTEDVPADHEGTPELYVENKETPLSRIAKLGIGYLEANVSGVPVGLYDLKGQPFPNTTPDLRSNPSPTLDFPTSGGIVEEFYKKRKKINTIMTMEYSSSNQGFWKLTDLTKNIDTLYGNSYDSDDEFNNDFQGIFHLHANKAYWVNVDSVSSSNTRPQNINEAINMKDSTVTMQSYTHFSNTFKKGISTTQNHINHRLNIKFADKFIPLTGEGKDYYNVVAIIKGQRYFLRKDGAYFSLDINDNEMPLLEKLTKTINNNQVTEPHEAIVLEIYDGTGVAFKEMSSNAHFKIKYFKPPTPTLTWNEDNDLIVDDYSQTDIDNNISTLELYARSVSDIKRERSKSLLTENNLSNNKDDILKWEYGNDESFYGGLSAIRAIIKKQDENKSVSFYSDIRAFLYAPIKKGHTLEANTTNKISNMPYSYISNSKLTKDNGVQIAYTHRNQDIGKIAMSYFPEGKEGIKSLQGTGFGASRTMFLRVNTGTTEQDAIANIKYIPEYIGKIFYIYFDGKLYQGRFANDDIYSNDGNAYNLESATISTDTFVNGTGSQADGSGGRVVDGGGQGI